MNLRLKKKNNSGYLLVEVLVTIVILATAIVFIVRALSSCLLAVRRATGYTKALLLAEKLDWQMRQEASSGSLISVDSFPRSDVLSEGQIDFKYRQELFPTEIDNISEMSLTISWKDAKASGEFSLSTFIPTTAVE